MLRGVSFYRGTHQKDQWPRGDIAHDSFQLVHKIGLKLQSRKQGLLRDRSQKKSSKKLILLYITLEHLIPLPSIIYSCIQEILSREAGQIIQNS